MGRGFRSTATLLAAVAGDVTRTRDVVPLTVERLVRREPVLRSHAACEFDSAIDRGGGKNSAAHSISLSCPSPRVCAGVRRVSASRRLRATRFISDA